VEHELGPNVFEEPFGIAAIREVTLAVLRHDGIEPTSAKPIDEV